MKKAFFTLAFACGLVSLSAQTTNGLIAKYSFNGGNANDEVGSNNGTISGATLTSDRFGASNQAYQFDGVDDFLSLGNSSSIKPATGSISVWAKMDSVSTTGTGYAYNPIFVWKNSTNNSFFEATSLYINSTDKRVLALCTNPANNMERFIWTTDSMSTGIWKHFVLTYDDDSLALFVNGQLEARSYKGFTSIFDANENIFFGKSGNTVNNRYFSGALDDIFIYDRVLTAAEILEIYNYDPIGISENLSRENTVQLFPNPARELATLSQAPAGAAISVVDLSGRTLLSYIANNEGIADINTATLLSGVYLVRVESEGKTSHNKLIISR